MMARFLAAAVLCCAFAVLPPRRTRICSSSRVSRATRSTSRSFTSGRWRSWTRRSGSASPTRMWRISDKPEQDPRTFAGADETTLRRRSPPSPRGQAERRGVHPVDWARRLRRPHRRVQSAGAGSGGCRLREAAGRALRAARGVREHRELDGAFVSLAGPGRIIVTATKTGGERNETRFPAFFVEAFGDEAADRDRNGRVSALEAFDYAPRVVASYEQGGHILTSTRCSTTGAKEAGGDAVSGAARVQRPRPHGGSEAPRAPR